MHARIQKEKEPETSKNEWVKVMIDEDDCDDMEQLKKLKKAKKKLPTSTEIDQLQTIFERHKNTASCDPFGRNDIFKPEIILDHMQKQDWPPLPRIALMSQQDADADAIRYKQIGDGLVKDYMEAMIKKGTFLPRDTVNTIPFIDVSEWLHDPKQKDSDTLPSIAFSKKEIQAIREYGWKTFTPYFEEQIIKFSKYKYVYIKLLSVNKKEKTFTIHREVYMSNNAMWLCASKMDIQFSFEEARDGQVAAQIDIVNQELYEQLLSGGIPDMNWNKQKIKLWTDMFSCPSKPTDLMLLKLTKDDEPIQTILAYGSKEKNTIMKAFKNHCHMLSKEETRVEYASTLREKIIPDYVNLMGGLFILFSETPITSDENESFVQKCGKVLIRSELPIKRKDCVICQ